METALKTPWTAHAFDIGCVIGNLSSYGMYNAADIVGTGVLLMAFVGSSTDVHTKLTITKYISVKTTSLWSFFSINPNTCGILYVQKQSALFSKAI